MGLLLGGVAAGRYRIVRRHAEGGLGAVYLAHDEELHREVALKEILARHAQNVESRERFLLEAEVTGGLEHPGIVPVYGLGEYPDGRPYYAMRFIRGKSLKDAISEFHKAEGSERDPSERALAFRRLLTHFVDVCEALAYAHSRGVLHRDLKPENIMLGKFGETLVVDWGLAKPLGRRYEADGAAGQPIILASNLTAEFQGHGLNTMPEQGLSSSSPDKSLFADDRACDSSAETIDEGPATLTSSAIDAATLDLGSNLSQASDPTSETLDLSPTISDVGDKSAATIAQGLSEGDFAANPAQTIDVAPSLPASPDSASQTVDLGATLPISSDAAEATMDLDPSRVASADAAAATIDDQAMPPISRAPASEDSAFAQPVSGSADAWATTLQERPLVPNSLGRSSMTLVGSLMGTPSFMSPEQASGHTDRLGPASDIYSLGATLYNLLTGVPPIVGGQPLKILSRVVIGDFPRPREVKASIPPALEAIVLKAMALKPEDRYPTARALSDELEQWMADEPVSAYRDPWPARMARWARRHKTAVSTVAALLLAAVVGLSGGSILLERERARTERERELAVRNYGYAYDAAETMLSRVGDVDLADIPQMEPVRRELLETAKLRFQNLLGQQSGDPEVILLESRTRARLGSVQEMIGQYTDAEKNDRDAIASLKSLAAKRPDDDRPVLELARARHNLGVLLRKLNRFREAEVELREAVLLREQLAQKTPADRSITRSLTDSRYQLGALLARLAGRPEDKVFYNQVIKDQEAELQLDPSQPENRIKLAQYRNNLAMLEASTNPTLAEKDYRRILDLLTASSLNAAQSALPGVRWQSARASNNLARILLTEKPPREEASENELTRARDSLSRLNAEFPQIRQYRRELASVYNNLGLLSLRRGKFQEAKAAFQESANLLKGLVASDPHVPDYQQNYSIALFQLESLRAKTDLEGAKAGMARVLADQEKMIEGHPEVPDYRNALGRTLVDYGKLLLNRGQAAEAKPLAEKAAARLREALEGDPGNRMYTQNLYEAHVLNLLIALNSKKHEAIAQSSESLVAATPTIRDAYLTAAAGLAECLALVNADEKLNSEEREQRAEVYGRRAVELLREGVDRHLITGPEPLRAKELVPLRSRLDFRILLKELIERQQPAAA